MALTNRKYSQASSKLQTAQSPRQYLWPTYAPPIDLVFKSGQGAKLYSDSGDKYLDFVSGIAVTGFGHSHPDLVCALETAANGIWHLSNLFRVPEAERLAERLCKLTFGDRVFFTNSGTEAVEAGIKAIRGYQFSKGHPNKHRIIGLSSSFHGRTIAALGAAGNRAHSDGFIPFDYGFDHADWGDIKHLESLITEQTGGVILEPVRGEGGIDVLSQSYLSQVRALCDERGLLLMYDEVQSGAGRTGELFAYQHSGVAPDLMAIAKGIGGGFPMGACIATEKVGSAMTIGKHGSTFGGNPLAVTVGNKVMDLLMEEGFLNSVKEKGNLLKLELESLVTLYPEVIESVSGRGLMLGLTCRVPNTDLLAALRSNGLLVGKAGNNMLRLLPPLNIQNEDIFEAIGLLKKTFSGLGQ